MTSQKKSEYVHHWFNRIAKAYPQATALSRGKEQLSYQQLRRRSHFVADLIRQYGDAQGRPIAILLPDRWTQIVGVLGVLYANGAFMPVEDKLPARRLQAMLEIGHRSESDYVRSEMP